MTSLTNTAGVITQKYDYDAFGNLRDIGGYSSDNDANPFRYCGEYFDEETGTIYLRNRYYNPAIGRFTREDPIRDGLNWYVYCSNNSVRFIDPSGLVEVGLRNYAATYEGSTVTWDAEKGAATVTYGNRNLTVVATAGNSRDGHIYVDDSLFVNKFGVGGKLIVYQDNVTDNVSIRGSFNYRGSPAYTRVPGSENDNPSYGITYSCAFLEGIEEHWSGVFGQYEVSTYARYHGDGINVSFKDELGISVMHGGLFGWSMSSPGRITMYYGDSREGGGLYSFEDFKWVAAHEFGHILGVGDAYSSKNSTGARSIFNEFGTEVQEDDITMVLNAWNTGKWQRWP